MTRFCTVLRDLHGHNRLVCIFVLSFGAKVINGSFARLITVGEHDFAEAWDLFKRFHDKSWSFTDCTSRVIMERLGIQRAFAFDDDFRQFGTVEVVP